MSTQNTKESNVKNIVLITLSVIMLCYAFVVGIVPIIFNDKLKNKEIIPELEKLTQLKVDYDSATLKITPSFDVIVKFNNLKAEKKDVDMQVGSITSAVFVLNPLMLVSKNYVLKKCNLNGVEYFEVLDNGVPEIKTFLEKYSLLATAGGPYRVKTCPIEIKYLFIHSYNSNTGAYQERKKKTYDIDAESFASFIDYVSQGVVKTN